MLETPLRRYVYGVGVRAVHDVHDDGGDDVHADGDGDASGGVGAYAGVYTSSSSISVMTSIN